MSAEPPVDPDSAPIRAVLDEVLRVAGRGASGQVADYIPELARADPDAFGIALTSTLGHLYSAGDSAQAFTIQSVSKPFVYALAISDLGLDAVLEHVGVEPSGEPFNAISLDHRGRPANPMINAGAIVTSALVDGPDPDARFSRIHATLSGFAGRELSVDEAVYASESETGHRNRALGHLTLASGVLPRGVDDATSVYFRQCAVLVTATDLAVMGATLASGGINPVTGQRVVAEVVARDTLSVMQTCGMYDSSGSWAFRVGIPAKSGVGGGIVAVKPGQYGIGVFSPRLDEVGNSSHGVAALEVLSERFGLHLFSQPRHPASSIQSMTLEDNGARLHVVLRGELYFVTVEEFDYAIRDIVRRQEGGVCVLDLDLSATTRASTVADQLLRATFGLLSQQGIAVEVRDPSQVLSFPTNLG